MTNVIKVKFIRDGRPMGRAYAYYTPIEVAVDDIVELGSKNGIAKGIVTEINVPVEEIAIYGDAAKTILGKAPAVKEEEGSETDGTYETRTPKFQRN